MSKQLEKSCAHAIEAAVAQVARPCRARGAPPLPQAGPPSSELPLAGGYPSAALAAPLQQASRLQLSQACGSSPFDLRSQDCLTPSSRGSSRGSVDWPSSHGSRSSSGSSRGGVSSRDGAGAADEHSHTFPAEDTLIVFDWDDTLLPNFWLRRQGLSLDSRQCEVEQRRAELDKVADAARQSLLAAKRLGQVVIITSAERRWIELSCRKFLPALQEALEGVKLVSARSTYETYDRQDPVEWKTLAFAEELRLAFGELAPDGGRRVNVLSLGDSLDERQALLTSTARLPSCRRKSLKFAERPDLLQICEQHELVSSNLERLVHQDCDLDLQMLSE